METLPELDKQTKLNFVLDCRLAYIHEVAEREGCGILVAGPMALLLRMAYAQGYTDALTEKTPGLLLLEAPGFTIKNRKR